MHIGLVLIVLAFLAASLISLQFESIFFLSLSILMLIGMLKAVNICDIPNLVYENPSITIYLAIGYLFLGVCWATFKWYLYCLDKAAEYKEAKDTLYKYWLNNEIGQNAANDWTEEQKQVQWKEYLKSKAHKFNYGDIVPKISNSKHKLFIWVGYWPVSIVWTFLSDFITRTIQKIYDYLKGFWQRIAEYVFKDYLKDFEQ